MGGRFGSNNLDWSLRPCLGSFFFCLPLGCLITTCVTLTPEQALSSRSSKLRFPMKESLAALLPAPLPLFCEHSCQHSAGFRPVPYQAVEFQTLCLLFDSFSGRLGLSDAFLTLQAGRPGKTFLRLFGEGLWTPVYGGSKCKF